MAKETIASALDLHPTMAQKIIGQGAALRTLTAGLLAGEVKHHAWLLTGPKGVGKASLAYHIIINLLARGGMSEGGAMVPKDNIVVAEKSASKEAEEGGLFAGDLFGETPPPPPMTGSAAPQGEETTPPPARQDGGVEPSQPIPHDVIAKQLREGSHPHFLLLDKTIEGQTMGEEEGAAGPASRKNHISVAAVRRISNFLSFHGFQKNLPRVVMIDGAEDMTPAAANALLKNLEEPPANSIFFLISHRPGLLPATVRSRCFLLPLNPLSPDILGRALAQLLPAAGLAEQEAMATLADGSLGRAVDIYQQAGLNIYRDWLDFFSSADAEKPARRKKIIANLLAQENPSRAQLFLSLVEVFFLRLAHYTQKNFSPPFLQSFNHGLFQGEEKTFGLFLARRPLADWLDFWQGQKTALARGFPPKNLNRDYLVLQLLDETTQALQGA